MLGLATETLPRLVIVCPPISPVIVKDVGVTVLVPLAAAITLIPNRAGVILAVIPGG